MAGLDLSLRSSRSSSHSNHTAVGGSGSTGNSSKNLSHVPCKFFRQGICQAGQSCPFSHNLQGSLAADKLPCKYFQKGNCKFGLKCALAHFLPDGTRINGNSLRRRKDDHSTSQIPHSRSVPQDPVPDAYYNVDNHSINTSDLYRSGSNMYSSVNSHFDQSFTYKDEIMPTNANLTNSYMSDRTWNMADDYKLKQFSNGSVMSRTPDNKIDYYQETAARSATMVSPPNGVRYIRNSMSANGYTSTNNYQFSHNNAPNNLMSNSVSWNVSPTNTIVSSSWANSTPTTSPIDITMRNHSISLLETENFVPNKFRSNSTSNHPRPVFSNTTTSTSTPHSIFTRLPEEVFIDDEDDSEEQELYDGDMFLQDYVPGSLSDIILSPDEFQRRDSRSQSGTLQVRPTLDHLNDSFKKSKLEGVFLMD